MGAPRPAPARIQVVSAGEGLGDGIMLLPFLRALRAAAPAAHIAHLVSWRTSLAGPLRRFCVGLVDETREDLGFFRGVLPHPRLLRGLPAADLAFFLPTRWTRVWAARASLRAARIVTDLPGYIWSDGRPSLRRRPKRKWLRCLRLVEAAFDVPVVEPASPLLEPLPEAANWAHTALPPGQRYAGLYLGARPDRRAVPVTRGLEIGRGMLARGLTPVVLVGPQELATLGELRDALPGARFPGTEESGWPDLERVLALATRFELAVVKDGGLSHVVGGAGAPVIVFGIRLRPWWNVEPSSPQKWLPFGDEVHLHWAGRDAKHAAIAGVLAEVDALLAMPAVAARRERLGEG